MKKITLGEFVEAGEIDVQTGPFGTQLSASDYVNEGTPVINVRNIGYGSLIQEKLEYVSDETAEKLHAHILRKNDIVFGRKGSVDRHLLVDADLIGWMQGSDCIRIRVKSDRINPAFLSFCFCDETHKRWITNQSSNKATMASLNQEIIGRIEITLPEFTHQTRIAETLSRYDDLIANNRKRIGLLEESARMLFREWFVHLRFPGHERVKRVDGVPVGWKRCSLSDLAEVNRENVGKNYEGEIEYVDIAAVSPGQIDQTTSVDFRDAPSRARRKVSHGDVIWSCVRPNRRSHAVIMHPPGNLIVSTGFAVLSPVHVPTSYLYFFTTTDAFVGYLTSVAKGAAYPAVVAKDFAKADFLKPPDSLLEEFDRYCAPVFEQMHALRNQTHRLQSARDMLLPRLMSGEVAV